MSIQLDITFESYKAEFLKQIGGEKPYKTNLASVLRRINLYPFQQEIRDAKERYVFWFGGRRVGKTEFAADEMTEEFLRQGRALYISPSPGQTNEVWRMLRKIYHRPLFDPNISELFKKKFRMVMNPRTIETRAGDTNAVELYTSVEEESLRGKWATLIIMDEYAYQNEHVYEEVIRNMLSDEGGRVIFMSTPPNPEKFSNKDFSKAEDPLHSIEMWRRTVDSPRYLNVHTPTWYNPKICPCNYTGTDPEWEHQTNCEISELKLDQSPAAFAIETAAEIRDVAGVAYFKESNFQYYGEDYGNLPWVTRPMPTFTKQGVGVDPNGTGTGDECGIIVGGANKQDIYIAEDHSAHVGPDQWPSIVRDAAEPNKTIIPETNYGGDQTRELIRAYERANDLSQSHIVPVHAREGKAARAGDIVQYYQRGQVYHHQSLRGGQLEKQMLRFRVNNRNSPDRVDSLVYLIKWLKQPQQVYVW